MRYWISIILWFWLLVFRMDAAFVSSPRVVDISPDAPVTGPLSLTNVFKNLANNTTYRLLPGTNTVQSTYINNLDTDPHLYLRDLTNVTIEGFGPHSVIYMAQTGSVFAIKNCKDIRFRNFAVDSEKAPSGFAFGGTPEQQALFDVKGTNGFIVWDNVTFSDCWFGIASLSEPRNSTNCTVKNCTFKNLGYISLTGPLTSDGGAIVILGPDMTVVDNYFEGCRMAFELEGLAPTTGVPQHNIRFSRNTCMNTQRNVWMDGGSASALWRDIIISDNFMFWDAAQDRTDPFALAILVLGGSHGIIANNVIDGSRQAIDFSANSGATRQIVSWKIVNNTITNTAQQSIYFDANVQGDIKGTIVSGNQIWNCGSAGIVVRGIYGMFTDNVISVGDSTTAGILVNQFAVGGNVADSNRISGNYVFAVGTAPTYGIQVAANTTGTIITDNHLRNFATAGITDAGTATVRLRNWVGAHFEEAASVAVNLLADNSTVDCTNRVYIQLSSDNATATSRTFVLSQSGKGTVLTLEWVGTNAGEILDDSVNTGGGNARLSATWTPTQYDVLILKFNGTDWIEQWRSTN